MSLLNWLRKSEGEDPTPAKAGEIPQLGSRDNLDEVLEQDSVMIFKHSTACPVSWAAHLQVMKFRDEFPDFPLRMVPVIQERAMSNKIAERTGVRHESPQVLLVKRGEVAGTISHGSITIAQLKQLATK